MNTGHYEFFGALLAGLGFGLLGVGYYFSGFILGSISCVFLLIHFYVTGQKSLLTLQAYFAIVNVLGIYNNFGVTV
jgi:hypothetical protein